MDRGNEYKMGGIMVYHVKIVIIMASMSVLALHGGERHSIDENDPRLWRELDALSRDRSASEEYDAEAYREPLRVLESIDRTISRDKLAINDRDPRSTAVKRGSSSQFGLGDLEEAQPDCCKDIRAHCRSLRQYATCICLVALAGFSIVMWKTMDSSF